MDYSKALEQLHAEHARLSRAIVVLEGMQASLRNASAVDVRRGRKSMSAAERREVAERMRNYWAQRRGGKGSGKSTAH